jgi:small-conductance mechanosensitive channel
MADPKPDGPAAQPETAEQVVEGLRGRIDPAIQYIHETSERLAETYLSLDGLVLLAVVIGMGVLAYFLAGPVKALIARAWPGDTDASTRRGLDIVQHLVFPVVWSLLLWASTETLAAFNLPNELSRIVASLLNAWVVIRLFTSFMCDPLWSRTIAAIAWTIAALNILHLLNPTIALLSSASFSIGEREITLYMILKAGVIAMILIWIASVLSTFIQGRVRRAQSLTPSAQTLIGHAVRLGLLFGAIIIALNVIGIDLTALAVFSGAIGIGIGFGLQAIFSNLVAGIIMLFEGGIKVGDFVDLDQGLTGEVKEIGIRATRVTTNDNVDILVPNSEFINNRVTNWTLREGFRRMRFPFGVAYGTDKELVRKAALEAAENVPHQLTGTGARAPEVWLSGFGDSSLDFELVVWLAPEAVKRPSRVNADYTWALETALTKYGIEIPFPQRDLHFRSGEIPVRIDPPATPKESA